MKKLLILLCIALLLPVHAYPSEQDWIEQEIEGDDVPLDESYSYSREEEESPVYKYLKALREVVPKKFKGEMIFRTRQDELAGDPLNTADYWYEKFSAAMDWEKQHAETGILSLRRFGEPGVSGKTFAKYHIKKIWFKLDNAFDRETIVAGNYKAQYGQGLVFYGSVIEFTRPIVVKPKGLSPDRGTNPNAYLNGFGWTNTYGRLSCAGFVSRSWLSADLNSDGSVDENLYDLKNDYGFLDTDAGQERFRRFSEDLIGGRIGYTVADGMSVGYTGYEAWYNKTVNPSRTAEKFAHVFRGDRNTVGGVDVTFKNNEFSFLSEYAFSKTRGGDASPKEGNAWVVTPLMHIKPWKLFITVYDYDSSFFNRHAKGPSFNNADPNNQKGMLYGAVYRSKPHRLFITYRSAQTEESEWTGSAGSSSPRFPADLKEIYIEYSLRIIRSFEIGSRIWNDTRDRYIDIDPTNVSLLSQTQQERKRGRLQTTWTPSNKFRYRVRYDTRVEKIDLIGKRLSGELVFGEITYKPVKDIYISFRQTVFDSGGTFLSQYEPVWYGIHQSNSFFSQKGIRSLIVLRYTLSSHASVWTRYGRTELTSGSIREDFRLQTNIHF